MQERAGTRRIIQETAPHHERGARDLFWMEGAFLAKRRSEMDPAYCWDLTDIFASEDAWEQALKDAAAKVAAIPALAGTLGASAEALKAGLDAVYGAARAAELVYIYAARAAP